MLAAAMLAVIASAVSAAAATLMVGPDQQYKAPSEAARDAMPGDTIQIAAGTYFDCVVWQTDNLTIVGTGSGAVLTDKTCQGKAIFVTVGKNITIRNLTFARARVPDFNGAGIRAEGANLHVEHSRFINNQSGILAASEPDSKINILDSQFIENGQCYSNHCTGALTIGGIASLNIRHCFFWGTKGGDHILSKARRTELTDSRIADGLAGTAAYLVDLPGGGSLIMRGNQLEKGLHSGHPGIAVKVMAGFGAQPVSNLVFELNHLRTDTNGKLVFVSNWSGLGAQMSGNSFQGAVVPISSAGYAWFASKSFMRYSLDSAKALAKAFAHQIKSYL
jgi:hypothetical protein